MPRDTVVKELCMWGLSGSLPAPHLPRKNGPELQLKTGALKVSGPPSACCTPCVF